MLVDCNPVEAALRTSRALAAPWPKVQVFEAAEEALQLEERAKDQLCQELNLLVQQSAHAQIEKLEQLTQRLEYLNKVQLPAARRAVAGLWLVPCAQALGACAGHEPPAGRPCACAPSAVVAAAACSASR